MTGPGDVDAVGPPSRRRLLGLGAAAAATVAAGGVTSCSRGGGDRAGAAVRVIAPDRRRPAPVLSGRTLHGVPLSVAAWTGSPVVVNIWGSWCPPCRDEAPALTRAAQQLGAKGVRFLGIDVQESGGTAAALAYVATYGVPFESLVDADGSLQLGFAGIVALSAPPSTIVLDARHRVGAVVTGSIGTTRTLVDLVGDVTGGAA